MGGRGGWETMRGRGQCHKQHSTAIIMPLSLSQPTTAGSKGKGASAGHQLSLSAWLSHAANKHRFWGAVEKGPAASPYPASRCLDAPPLHPREPGSPPPLHLAGGAPQTLHAVSAAAAATWITLRLGFCSLGGLGVQLTAGE